MATIKASFALLAAFALLLILVALASLGAYMQPMKWSERRIWSQ